MHTPAHRPDSTSGEHDYEQVTRGQNTRNEAEDAARETAASLTSGHAIGPAVHAEPSYEQVTRGDNTREEAEQAATHAARESARGVQL